MDKGGLVLSLISDFNRAKTTHEYNAAKTRAEKEVGTLGILALVDTMIDAHNRINQAVR